MIVLGWAEAGDEEGPNAERVEVTGTTVRVSTREGQVRSTTMATPCPPPMHRAATP